MSSTGRQQASPRKKGRVMVRFGVDTPDRTAFTMNLSVTGAFIRTNSVFKPGTRLQVEFDLPEGKVALWAQVVWAKKVPAQLAHTIRCGMGVRFVNAGEEWTTAFERWQVGKPGG